jgi:hypothetical protein
MSMHLPKIDSNSAYVGVAIGTLFVTMWDAVAGCSLAVTFLLISLLHYLRHHRRLSRAKRLAALAAVAALLAAGVVLLLRIFESVMVVGA